MRRWVGAAIVAVTVAVSGGLVRGQAQSFFAGAVDAPLPSSEPWATMPYGTFRIDGWALSCAMGMAPEHVSVVLHRLSAGSPEYWAPSAMYRTLSVYRPDVAAVYHNTCPAISDYTTGYGLTFDTQPPPGYWRVDLVWSQTPGDPAVGTQSFIVEIE